MHPKTFLILISFLFQLLIPGCSDELKEPPYPLLKGYAATLQKGIYKTENGGTSWFPLKALQTGLTIYQRKLRNKPLNSYRWLSITLRNVGHL